MTEHPNILLILTDQQSATMMSCSGNGYVHTPAIDSIARQGLRFERAYCMNPMCAPSRFSLFTGRRGSEIGLLNNTDDHIDQLPAAIAAGALGWRLRSAGYRTAYGGKTHFPKGLRAEDLGFETISSDDRDQLAADCADFLAADHDRPFFLVASFINPHDICHMAIRDFAETKLEQRLSQPDRIELRELDQALRIPADMSREEFFATICPPLPDNFPTQQGEPEAIRLMQARSPFKRKARERYSEEDWRLHRWAYARLTERVDGQVGTVLAALRENHLEEDTVLVFTSDHGDMDGSHRMEHKTAFYEEAARIPLIIAGARVERRNAVDASLVSNGLDLLPTLCELVGVQPPQDGEGRSLMPLLNGMDMREWRDVLPLESELGQMIVKSQFKYMRYYQGEDSEQLIDLEHDPGETRNAAHDPHHASVVEAMRRDFRQMFPACTDLFQPARR